MCENIKQKMLRNSSNRLKLPGIFFFPNMIFFLRFLELIEILLYGFRKKLFHKLNPFQSQYLAATIIFSAEGKFQFLTFSKCFKKW